MNVKKLLYILLGGIGLIVGAIGAVLPLLPSFPFLLLAAICFSKSSEKLNRWFKGTKLYQNNLESYVNGQGMTKQAKLRVIGCVTLLMTFGFCMMLRKQLYVPCMILAGVWLFHILYFCFGVKRYVPEE